MVKIFDLFEVENIEIKDPGLKDYINLEPKFIVKSRGRNRARFSKAKVSIIERIINTIQIAGHRGKKHKLMTYWSTGKYSKNAKMLIEAFKLIEKKTGKNPIAVLVKAIENAAPRDEITVIEYGGARYPQAVDTSPLRRVNLAIRHIVHGAYDKSFNKKKKFAESLADEIIAVSEMSNETYAIQKKNELEKQADASR